MEALQGVYKGELGLYQVRPGAQGASRVAPGKSGLHVRGEGERIIALELW